MHEQEHLPLAFCWTRYGTEAGEGIEAILERKERERRANDGIFFWGIGNSVAPAIAELVFRQPVSEVLFSPIRSRPRVVDVHPPSLTRWHGAVTLAGERIALPETVCIMSGNVRRPHYALVCASSAPLRRTDIGRLYFGALRNLVSGNPVGASQVTAVVRRVRNRTNGHEYVVALRARLVDPYFVRLADPRPESAVGSLDRAQVA